MTGLGLALAACADPSVAPSATTATPITDPANVAAEEPAVPTDPNDAATEATPASSPARAEVSFEWTVADATREALGSSWNEGCPVAVEELQTLSMTHWDDDQSVVSGDLVIHRDHVQDIVAVFRKLFDARFPIHLMQPITAFAGDDNESMRANNTSGFNCREIDGRPGVWSQHSYGGAIDINPLVNPWVRGAQVDPAEGVAYLDRDPAVTGLIVAGDVATSAFAAIGWGWGGDWTSSLDYQHFSHNGR